MSGQADFDRDALIARMGGDRELLRELIGAFLEEVPDRLSALHAAADAGDGTAVQRAAHVFKGSIAVFAARTALDAVSAIETSGLAGDLPRARLAIASLERAIGPLCDDLREMAA